MALISVSIDIAGSTELKRQIKEISKGNQDNINRLYREYAQRIYCMEMDLYLLLVNGKLELENLFVIKNLGDESWFVYDINDMDTKTLQFNKIFHTIFHALANIHKKYYDIFMSERKPSPGEEINEKSPFRWTWPDIAAKAYMDLIKDYEEISDVRRKVFLERNSDFFSLDELRLGEKFRPEKLSKLISNFNIGNFWSMIDNKITISHRFDPIGFEVDLFFRCTKFAYPGITGIGKNLFQNLYGVRIEDFKPNETIRNYNMAVGNPNQVRFYNYDILHCREIKKNKIKGIGGNYNIYYLINESYLPNDISLRINEPHGIYKETFDFLNKINFWKNDSTLG